jgi:hypothetical protein
MNNVLTKEEPDSLLGITSLYRLLPPPQLEQVKPALQLPDTTRFLDEIGELEEAFNRGRLRPHLKWACRRVAGVYRKVLSTPEARNPLRATAFRTCKSIFEREIRPPTTIFDAESLRTAVAFGELAPLAWRSQEIQVQVHQAALCAGGALATVSSRKNLTVPWKEPFSMAPWAVFFRTLIR